MSAVPDTFELTVQTHLRMPVVSKRTGYRGTITWVAKNGAWVLVDLTRGGGSTYYRRDEIMCVMCADHGHIETDPPDIDAYPHYVDCPCTYAYGEDEPAPE